MLSLIFMGTPDFAVPTLQALIDSPHRVVAVYSQPPRPAGRGQKETKSPVHQLAEQHNIPVHTPVSLKSPEAQETFRNHKADAAIVAAYGLLLPKAILEACPMGCLNVHPSLLPRWRGAAPIQRTIMAGDTRTAVCIMQMDAGLDTGDVLMTETFEIPNSWNAGELHDVCAEMGGRLILRTLEGLVSKSIQPIKQSAEGVTYAHKISKEDARIDWQKPVRDIANHIRGLSPYPGAVTSLNGEMIKILAADIEPYKSMDMGMVIDSHFGIACIDGLLRPTFVQRPGKKAMPVNEMLRGWQIAPGTKLE